MVMPFRAALKENTATMKIIHFSDPHAGGKAEDWMAYFDKRWVGVFNYRFRRRFRHDLGKLQKAVDYILATRPEVAVCTGDLTSTGQPGEFDEVKEILTPLRESGIPVLYVPGNHDCYVPHQKCVRAVNEMVVWLTSGNYKFEDLPVVRYIGSCEFVIINSSWPSNLLCSWGFLKPDTRNFLELHCDKNKHCPRILVGHYPIIEEHPVLRVRHRLFGQKKVVEMLKDGRIDLSLCGHVHKPYRHVDDFGRGESCAGSVTRNGTMTEIEYVEKDDNFKFKQIVLT